MGILFGELVDDMNGATCAADASLATTSAPVDPFAYEGAINDKVLMLVYIAIAAFVLIYVYVLSWSLVSQRLAQRLRGRYVQALLRQPPGFFDARAAAAGEVSSRLHGDMTAVQAGTSEKVGILIASISFFIACYVVAFIKQAKLAGILVSLVPAFLLMAMGGGFFVQKYTARMSVGVATASDIASEALQHVAVVQAFGAAPRLETKFAEHVAEARGAGVKKGVAAACQAGLLYFIAYSANALAFWQGSRMVVDTMTGNGTETVGQIYTVVFLLVDGMCDSSSWMAVCKLTFSSLRVPWQHRPHPPHPGWSFLRLPAPDEGYRGPLHYRRHLGRGPCPPRHHPWPNRPQQRHLRLPLPP
jgi:ABC-type multidrug transport system fused ATPase/permease subunit